MEVDGPQSPEMSSERPQEIAQDIIIPFENKENIHAKQAQSIDETTKENLKLEYLFKKLESNELNLNKKLSFALTIEIEYEDKIEILIKLFNFYKQNKQLQHAHNLFENLIKKFSFLEINSFDNELEALLITIIVYNLKQQQQQKISISPARISTTLLKKEFSNNPSVVNNTINYLFKHINNDMYDFYLNLFQNKPETLIINLLDKYRTYFQFLKINLINEVNSMTTTAAASNGNTANSISILYQLIKNLYKNLINNEFKLVLYKYLIKFYSKYIPGYGIQLIDFLLNAEKQIITSHNTLASLMTSASSSPQLVHSSSSSSSLAIDKRSLTLFRKLCVIDLIPEFINFIDNKLDNKIYYRWIEKSLEFYFKYVLNAIYLLNVDYKNKFVLYGYKKVKLIQVCCLSIR